VPEADLRDVDRAAADVPILVAAHADAGVVLVALLEDVSVVLVACDVEAGCRLGEGIVTGSDLSDGALVEVALMANVGTVLRAGGLGDLTFVLITGLLDITELLGSSLRDVGVVVAAGLLDDSFVLGAGARREAEREREEEEVLHGP